MANNKPTASSLYVKSLQMQSQIKRDQLPPDSKLYTSERLSSFRLPRDLTLGGVRTKNPIDRPNLIQSNKKVYTPNLNAIRNKNVDVKTSRDTSITRGRGRGRGRGGRGRDSGPGRDAGTVNRTPRNTVVASSGLFSEGAGDGTTKHFTRSFRGGGGGDDSTASTLRRPTLSSKREKIDPQAEQKHISEIYDLDMDETDDMNGDSYNEQHTPINLLQVKSETKLEDRINTMEIKEENRESTKARLKYPNDLGEFFDRNIPQLFLMQLPDALPGHGTESEPEPADSAELQETTRLQENLCTMRNLEEGQIGRLVRYRSGKTKLLLGDSKFDIDLGIDPNLLQEVVSTQINKSDRIGSVINLGQINAKLSAVPDWEFILDNIADKKS